jgi:DNA replication protein DnaC
MCKNCYYLHFFTHRDFCSLVWSFIVKQYLAEYPEFNGDSVQHSDQVKLLSSSGNVYAVLYSTWLRQTQNLLLFGTSGVGKTHLACAIGHGLLAQGIAVKCYNAMALVQQLQSAKQSLVLEKYLTKLDRYRLLIIDDIGYVKKSEQETSVLFELIAHRYESGSLLITSNQPFSQWESIFTDATMAVAAIDRLVHHSTIVEIQADSYRKQTALNTLKTEANS